jgi:hypothetical protein
MKDRKAFRVSSKTKQPRPISFQLLVFLYCIGKEGIHGGSIEVATHFGIGKGSVNNYIRRCVKALLEIKKDTVVWPNAEERETIKKTTGCKRLPPLCGDNRWYFDSTGLQT